MKRHCWIPCKNCYGQIEGEADLTLGIYTVLVPHFCKNKSLCENQALAKMSITGVREVNDGDTDCTEL